MAADDFNQLPSDITNPENFINNVGQGDPDRRGRSHAAQAASNISPPGFEIQGLGKRFVLGPGKAGAGIGLVGSVC